MAIPMSHEVKEGQQTIRRGEGIVYTVNVANWTSSTPSAITVTVTRISDDQDVTSTFIPTGSATVSSTTITLPEILVPSDASKGRYQVDIQFEAGGYSPGIVALILRVY